MGWVEDKLEAGLGKLADVFTQESEKTRLAFAQAMAESVRGQRIAGALSRPITPNAVNYTVGGRLVGWSLRSTGGDVVVNFYDGPAADPTRLIATVAIASGASTTAPTMHAGASFTDSLYVEVTGAGTVLGAVWIGAVD